MLSNLQEALYQNQEVECACGCGQKFPQWKISGRVAYRRVYLAGHQLRKKDFPGSLEKKVLIVVRKGYRSRADIARLIQGVDRIRLNGAISRLKRKGLIDNPNHNCWELTPKGEEVICAKNDEDRNPVVYPYSQPGSSRYRRENQGLLLRSGCP